MWWWWVTREPGPSAAQRRILARTSPDAPVFVSDISLWEVATLVSLGRLERMLAESGVGAPADIDRAKSESAGLGLFVRSLIGLDREAAKETLASFLCGKTPTANQIEFINLIVDHLTEHGVMAAERLYESPFTDVAPHGLDGIFSPGEVHDLLAVLASVRQRAAA